MDSFGRGKMASEDEDQSGQLYSGNDFLYNLDESVDYIEDEDAEKAEGSQDSGKKKMRSSVTIHHIGLTNEGASTSSGKGKTGSKSAAKNGVREEKDRSCSPLILGRRVSFEEGERERDQRIVDDVTRNLRAEISALMEQVRPQESPAAEELDRLKVEQRTNSLMAKASLLSSEGAKAQFLAFPRIKASAEEVRRKIAAGDGLAAAEVLDRLERVVDLRLETIQRADKSPGGWSVATVFERMAYNADANQPKLDRCWKAAAAQVDEKKESRKTASRGRPTERGRGNYSFRLVRLSYLHPSLFSLYLLRVIALNIRNPVVSKNASFFLFC